MFLDAKSVPQGATLSCDVCIVGSGHAGISVAMELADGPHRVIVLESGGLKPEKETQDLYRGDSHNPRHSDLHMYRERRFGGTSTVWGGRCSPYDQVDFEDRRYRPHSNGWPISRSELDGYYERAYERCDLGRYGTEVSELLPGRQPFMIPGLDSESVKTDRVWLFSLPTDFGAKYRHALSAAENIDLYLHANCVSIETRPDGSSVDSVDVATLAGNRFHVRAKHYVLGAGGLETIRLLLASDKHHEAGIGNAHGQLGRFYCSHIAGDVGPVRLSPKGPLAWDYDRTVDGVYCRRALRIDEAALRERRLPNIRLILNSHEPADPAHGSSVLSAMYLVKRLFVRRIPPEYSRSLSGMGPYQHVFKHVRNCLVGLPSLFMFSVNWFLKRTIRQRKLPSLVLRNKRNEYYLHFDAEQIPNPDSRVRLTDEVDALGMRKLSVDWDYTDGDVEGVLGALTLVADELERTGTGTFLVDADGMREAIRRTGVGSHNYAAARMAGRPEDGVVDPDCRVFGVDNLFVASSVTFPTTSFANPALTICALAIRIADHLKGLLAE